MLIDADQLDTSPPEWLVKDMIPRVGTGFWYGKRWTGKSLAVDVELALAVANGTPFFGREVIQGTVIVGLGEGLPDAGVRKQARLAREQDDRIAKAAYIAMSHGDEVAKAWLSQQPPYTDDNLKYLTKPFTLPLAWGDEDGEVSQSMRTFINKASKYPDLELVILDAVSDFTKISITNDASANRVMLGMKTLVRELNCCVLAVAHPTEDGKKMLGAGRLGNAADFIIASRQDGNMTSTVSCEKNKYGGRFDPFGYIVEPVEFDSPVLDADDEPTGETVVVKTATIRSIDDDMDDIRTRKPKRPLPKLRRSDDGRPRKRSGVLRSVAGRF
jgi:hypothetical protein